MNDDYAAKFIKYDDIHRFILKESEQRNWKLIIFGNTRKQAYNFGTDEDQTFTLTLIPTIKLVIDIRCREFSLHRNVHLIKKENPITLGVIILKLYLS